MNFLDTQKKIIEIIEKLTSNTSSILSEKVFNIAAEVGIGDNLVNDCLEQLIEDKYIAVPVHGVIKKK